MYDGPDRRDQWYSNKELFEKLTQLEHSLSGLQRDLSLYNGLHEKVQLITDRITDQENICKDRLARLQGKNDIGQLLLKIWPIVMSTIIFAASIWTVMR